MQRTNAGDRLPFSFTAQFNAEYHFCLKDVITSQGVSGNRIGSVVWDESGSSQFQDVAKKADLKPLEKELSSLVDKAKRLKSEFTYMRDREQLHRDTSGSFR